MNERTWFGSYFNPRRLVAAAAKKGQQALQTIELVANRSQKFGFEDITRAMVLRGVQLADAKVILMTLGNLSEDDARAIVLDVDEKFVGAEVQEGDEVAF